MTIKDNEISFVVQGPLSSSNNRIQQENITKHNLQSIRLLFPDSCIILSTWNDQDASELETFCDKILFLDDPGPNIVYDDGVAQKLNNNRQLYSSHQGLLASGTKYSAKVRSDNLIKGRGFLQLFEEMGMCTETI